MKPFWVGPSQGSLSHFYLLMRNPFFYLQLKVGRMAHHPGAGSSHFLHTRRVCGRPAHACKHTFKNVYVGLSRRRPRHTGLHKTQVFSVRPCFLGLYPEAFQEADIPFQRVPARRSEDAAYRANLQPPTHTAVYCSVTDAAGISGHRRTAPHVWLQLS